jgi:hypothetical protein
MANHYPPIGIASLTRFVMDECDKYGVTFRMMPCKTITTEGMSLGGAFDVEENTLTVAACNPKWYLYIAHEYGHLLQAADGRFNMSFDEATYRKMCKKPDPYVEFTQWLGGCELKPQKIKSTLEFVIECELDAERTASDLLSNYGIYDADDYAKRANLILYAWAYCGQSRVFSVPKKTPAFKKAIPNALLSKAEDYFNMPPAIRKAFDQHHEAHLDKKD